MTKSLLIEVDGVDGAGKTSFIKCLDSWLKSPIIDAPIKTKIIRTVGFDEESNLIRNVYVNSVPDESKKYLMCYFHTKVNSVIKEYMDYGSIVIQDRGLGSFYVNNLKTYNQEHAVELLNLLHNSKDKIKPDIYIYVSARHDILRERIIKRLTENNNNNSNDLDSIALCHIAEMKFNYESYISKYFPNNTEPSNVIGVVVSENKDFIRVLNNGNIDDLNNIAKDVCDIILQKIK